MWMRTLVRHAFVVLCFGACACNFTRSASGAQAADQRIPPVEALIASLRVDLSGSPDTAAKVIHFDNPSHARVIVPPLAEALKQWGRFESLVRDKKWGEPQEPLACLLVGLPFRHIDDSSLKSGSSEVQGDTAEWSSDDGEYRYCFRRTADGWRWDGTSQLSLREDGAAERTAAYLDALAAALRQVADAGGGEGSGEPAAPEGGPAKSAAALVDRATCLRLLGPHFKGGGVAPAPKLVKGERRLADRAGRLTCMAVSPDGKRVAAGATHSPTPLRVWDLAAGRVVTEAQFPPSDLAHVHAVACSPDGARLIATGTAVSVAGILSYLREWAGNDPWENLREEPAVWQFDAATGRLARTFEPPKSALHETLSLSPDGRLAASTSFDTTYLWDTDTGKVVRTLGEGGDAVAFASAGELVVREPPEGIAVYEVATGRKLRTLKVSDNRAERPEGAMAVSPDGKTIAYGTLVSVNLIGAADGRVVTKLVQPDALTGIGRVNSIEFSPDGKRLLAATGLYSLDDRKEPTLVRTNRSRDVCLWAVPGGKLLARCQGHTGAVSGAAFLREGREAVSTSTDGTIRIWTLRDGGQ